MQKYILLFSLALVGCSYGFNSPQSEFLDKSLVEFIDLAESGETDRMKESLAAKLNLNQPGNSGLTPLYWLLAYGDQTAQAKQGFQFMLEHGAEVMSLDNKFGKTALHYAARMPDSDYLSLILKYADYDIDVTRPGNSWNTPLLQAVFYDQNDNLALLIEYGASLEIKNPRGQPPLSMAAVINWQAAYIMLQAGADYSFKDPRSTYDTTDIVGALERLRLKFPSKDGINYRQKVIEFLRDEGVTVDPWLLGGWLEVHSEAPPEPERQQLAPQKNVYSDVDVYKIGPEDEDYAIEVLDIYNPAVVNVTHEVRGKVIDAITVEIVGDRQERLSTYNFQRGRLAGVRKTTKIYQFPKWDDKHAPEVFTEEILEAQFAGNNVRLASFVKDGESVDCAETDLCETETAKIFHDIGVYELLGFN